MERINESERQAFLDAHDGWTIDGETITRRFVFTDFNEAMGFVNRVALASEVADHHPDIDIRWNKVTISLTTHDADGLTAKDTDLASRIDQFA